ncbi:MAG: PilX N-terminal domain-containing pilus assembly protein [Tepidimonas sp.]|uniref:pilus assembly PilX family protein n=1 Tax=Tepidimonas sp. TaxID=2002775 RepID=UPI00259E8E14|nr:PilX N-terminal domain-containing pilus assembly protein [Tepidimonas sp.]MDM7457029.1 PilX N-terminal domain-containing pilus assembly protein [Tepidimonas sp.]
MKRLSHRFLTRPPTLPQQGGFAFIIALIILLAVSILGVTTIRAALVEQRLATVSLDRNIAFQAAEAALHIGERVALQHARTVSPSPRLQADESCNPTVYQGCSTGICDQVDPDCSWRALDPDFTGWFTVTDADLNMGPLAGQQPAYLVEFLGGDYKCREPDPTKPSDPNNNCKRYRITARSQPDGSHRATVILETIYATE